MQFISDVVSVLQELVEMINHQRGVAEQGGCF